MKKKYSYGLPNGVYMDSNGDLGLLEGGHFYFESMYGEVRSVLLDNIQVVTALYLSAYLGPLEGNDEN